MREIVLDTESTGLDPAKGHRLVEIGGVELINRIPTGRVYHTYLNPDREVPEEAVRIHNLTYDFLRDKPFFKDIHQEFLDFLGDGQLVIHNAGFDLKFLNSELARVSTIVLSYDKTVDTLILARKKFPGSPANLDALCARFKVDTTQRIYHGALLDARLLAEVYIELMGGSQIHLSLDPSLNERAGSLSVQKKQKHYRPARHWEVVLKDQEEHKIFLETFNNALWKKYEKSFS